MKELPEYLLHMKPLPAAGYALAGYGVVFVGLVLLMTVIIITGKIMTARKAAPAKAAGPAGDDAGNVKSPVVQKMDGPYAPGSAGELKLHDVSEKDAALIMAIVADELGKPLNELRFKSIQEVK